MADRGGARLPIKSMTKVSQMARAAVAAVAVAIFSAPAFAGDVKIAGKLTAPERVPLTAVSTDPLIQQILDEDFRGAHRGPDSGGQPPITVTVTMNEKLLKPGLTLGALRPGDPLLISNMLKDLGEEPPPLGDTGDKPSDPYSTLARQQFMRPGDPMQGYRDYQTMENTVMRPSAPRFGANGNASEKEIYDLILVARATVSGSSDDLTAVAVIHPGDDVRAAKSLIAEEITNALLH